VKNNLLWVTRTAVFTALLIVWQYFSKGIGGTLVTGSGVNLLLILAVMTCGLSCGLSVAALSPILAFFAGIQGQLVLVPFICLSNIVLAVTWHIVGNFSKFPALIRLSAAAVIGASAKFAVCYLGVVKVAVPLLIRPPAEKAAAMSAAFSFPQLITALIGGAACVVALPLIKSALGRAVAR
jgi:hypothetical protein